MDKVTRFVITHVGKHGLRRLTFAQQGQFTYETREEAAAALEGLLSPYGLCKALTADEMKTLEVRPVPCWPGHFDPVTYYVE